MEDSFGGAKPKTPRRPSNHPVSSGKSSTEDHKKPKTPTNFRPLHHPLVVSKGNNSSNNRGDNSTQDTSRQSCLPLSHEDMGKNSEDSLFFKENHYDSQENQGCKQNVGKNGSPKSCQHCKNKDRKFIREFLPLTDELIQNAVKDSYTSGDDNGSPELEQPSRNMSEEIVSNGTHGPGHCKKKNKELTAREKWKKSGYALRKYLSSKFGFGDVSSRKSSNGKSSKRLQGNSNSVTNENLRHLEHDSIKNSEDSSCQANPISRSSSATSNGSEGKKDWSISFLKMFDLHREKRNSKVSKAEINNTRTDFSSSPSSPLQDTDSDWQSPFNPSNENAQYKPNICDCDCDWSMYLGGRRNTCCDWLTGSHDQSSVYRNPQMEFKCERWRRTKCEPPCKVKKSNKRMEKRVPRKHLVGVFDDMLKSSSDTECEKSKPTSCSKRRRRKSKDSSRTWYPAHPGEKSVESDETWKQARNDMETENQGFENDFRNQSTKIENDASGPMRSSALNGQPQKRLKPRLAAVKHKSPKAPQKGSDVLLGLKYALPYLPERLRNRLHSSSKESDHEQLPLSSMDQTCCNKDESGLKRNEEGDSNELDKLKAGECEKVKGNLTEQPQEQELNLDTYRGLNYRNGKIEKRAGDVEEKKCIDMKSNPSSYSEVIKRKKLLEDVDLEEYSGSPHHHRNKDNCIVKQMIPDDKAPKVNCNMKKRVCDTKFHLNDSGTWTMTLDDCESSDNDLGEIQGQGFSDTQGRFHDNLYRSVLASQNGELSRNRQTDWLRNDLTLLEADLEDPFNLRGDNLIINPSPPPKGNNSVSVKREYSDQGISFSKGCNSPNVSYSHSKGIKSLNLSEDGLPTNSTSSSHNRCHKEDINGLKESDCFSKLCSRQIDGKYAGNDAMACSSKVDISNGYSRRNEDTQKDNNSDVIKQRQVGEITQDYFEGTDLDLELMNQTRSLFKLSDTDEFSTDRSQHDKTLNEELNWDSFSSKNSDDDSSRAAMLPSEVDQRARSVWRCDNAIDELCSGLLRISPNDEEERSGNIMSHSSTLDDLEMERSRSLSLLTPESSLDADDEFECDCEYCLSLRYTTLNQLGDIESSERYLDQRLDMLEGIGTSNYLRYPESADVGTDIQTDLQSLDLIGTDPGQGLGTMLENVILQLLADNVIMQMIAVRPDLLSDQAPPPATQSIIDDIPTVSMSKEDLDQNPVCPVCLCPCVIDETMSRLPCLHIFHPICVQAWLVKSGTCPVCRYRMTP